MKPLSKDVTRWLVDWRNGHQEALDQLMPLVYDELRRLAHRYLHHESPGHTLQTTELVHEAYLRLVDQTEVRWQDRAHVFAMAATSMRRILIEHARRRRAAKRGAGAGALAFDEAIRGPERKEVSLIALDEALNRLATLDPQKSQLVELRFFGGLTLEETAEVLGIARATVAREWNLAKAWLYREIKK